MKFQVPGRLVVCGTLLVSLLVVSHRTLAQTTLVTRLSGLPVPAAPGFVPHGDPVVGGTAELTIYANNRMDYQIVLEDDRYAVTQAHLYNMNRTSGTSGNPAHGDSIICWGGRWANGGDSDDFLVGSGYVNSRLADVAADPTGWFLMIHTTGGHFAVDESGGLIPFNPSIHETNVLGVPESERTTRFNNRVGRTLDSLVLRQDNDRDSAAPFFDPGDPSNQNETPFPDANGTMWLEPDDGGGWQLTPDATAEGYDLSTQYLFYLYDDQGPLWDFGGPEGAMGGFLRDPFGLRGDLNLDGIVDTADWLLLIATYESDLSGLSPLEAFLAGDLNSDGVHSLADIQLFRRAFVEAGGNPADLVMPVIPEPATAVIVLAFLLTMTGRGRHSEFVRR